MIGVLCLTAVIVGVGVYFGMDNSAGASTLPEICETCNQVIGCNESANPLIGNEWYLWVMFAMGCIIVTLVFIVMLKSLATIKRGDMEFE